MVTATVSQLAQPLDMSQSAVVRSMAVLESCGLVRSAKVGRTRICRLEPLRLRVADDSFAGQRAGSGPPARPGGRVLAEDLAAEQAASTLERNLR